MSEHRFQGLSFWAARRAENRFKRSSDRRHRQRRLRLEPLEDRRLLTAYPFDVPVDAAAGEPWESVDGPFAAPAAAPAVPDLLSGSDTGVSDTDNITNRDNSEPGKTLQFTVSGTVADATVTLYIDGMVFGRTVATGSTTTFTTDGTYDLTDGEHTVTARQTVPEGDESADSPALTLTIDTAVPIFTDLAWLGRYDTSGDARDVVVAGTLAYVADGNSGLQIFDITDPAVPTRVGGYGITGYAYQVAVEGNRVYLAAGGALQIFDVTDPAVPIRLSRYETGGGAFGLSVAGNYAYVADLADGVRIFDVTDPAAPVPLGQYDTSGLAYGVTVVGDRAYVADGLSGLQVLDVSDPAAPTRLGGFNTSGSAQSVTVAGNLAYVADGAAGVQVIDVSNPAVPIRVGGYDTAGTAYEIALAGSAAYVADWDAGLQILDVSDPAAPAWLGGYATDDQPHAVAVAGGLICVADWAAGLQILQAAPTPDLQSSSDTGDSDTDNVTDDATPTFDVDVPVGSYFRFYRNSVQISGDFETGDSFTAPTQSPGTYDYTFALVDTAGNVSAPLALLQVTIVNPIPPAPSAPDLWADDDTGISNVDNITSQDNSSSEKTLRFNVGGTIAGATVTLYADGSVIGSAAATGDVTVVTTNGIHDLLDGSYAVTARQFLAGIPGSTYSTAVNVTIDTTAPGFSAPVWLGTYDANDQAQGIVVHGNLAYVTDEDAGLEIVDVGNPTAPVRLGGCDTSGSAHDLVVAGNLAYVADDVSGLQIIDVSNPAAPVRLGRYDTSGSAYDVAVAGNVAYVADGTAGLQIIDVSNPAAPVWLGGYDTSGTARHLFVVGNLVYVADEYSGIQIIDVNNPAAPVRLGGYDTVERARNVFVAGNLAYVANEDGGLQIIDVSDPTATVHVGEYDTQGKAYGVVVVDNLAYVAVYVNGLQIIDVGNPSNPVRLAKHSMANALDLAVVDNYVYVVDRGACFRILEVDPEWLPWPPDLQTASDTGTSDTDNITDDTTPTFDIPVPVSYYFRFYCDGEQISGDYETGTSFTTPVQELGVHNYTLALVDTAGNVSAHSTPLEVIIFTSPVEEAVVGRYVFYPEAGFSGYRTPPAPDKQALVPGPTAVTATFANVVSSPTGIRGIYIDVADLGNDPTADDFQFRIGRVANIAAWSALTVEPTITVSRGAGEGGSDRVALQWPANTIRNSWIEVKMLTTDDIFYFASVVGETNEPVSGTFLVNAADLVKVRDNPRMILVPAPINFPYDFNRDRLVNAVDFGLVRDNPATALTGVKVITLPAISPAPAATGEGMPPVPLDDWSGLDGEKTTRPSEADYPLLIDLLLSED